MNVKQQQLHNEIFELLTIRGDMGVNELARKVGRPVASIQKFLAEQQSYFVKNDRRRWQLPVVSKDWPKETPDEDIPERIRQFIEDPVANLGDILKTVNMWKSEIEITQRRMQFLKLLAERAVRNV